ncbi:MAG: carbohydrate porin [Sulfurimicrobium sp.]
MLPFKPGYLAASLAGIMLASSLPAVAAEPSQSELLKELRRLSERMEKLEARNAELEKKLQSTPAKPDEELAQRVKTLEENNARMETALESDRLSEKDPEVITRLKDIEFRTLSMQKQARMIESLEGITVGASLTMVAQSANKAAVAAGEPGSALNYRGDVSVTLPGGSIGNADGKVFAQFRLGQGNGLALNNTLSSTPNTTAFSLTNPDDSSAMLAQAWYQLGVPLPLGGHKPYSREHLEINFGKIDPFVFFDQNVVADDESSRFLNNAFVHNPLLDSGGDAGVDAYGFTPGVRIAYHNERQKPEWWRASMGVFGAGKGAGYDHSFSAPFVIGQLEFGRKFFGGLDGTYRLYAWRNGQSTAFQNEFDSTIERHSGVGASIDQRIGDATTLFARYGKNLSGKVRFDQALTLGAEFGGNYWNRSADSIGVALGWLRTAGDFRADSATLDADADGNPDFGYTATGAEQLAEIYYRTRLNKNLELTPDFQLIRRPGGDQSAASAKVLGLRAKVSF